MRAASRRLHLLAHGVGVQANRSGQVAHAERHRCIAEGIEERAAGRVGEGHVAIGVEHACILHGL